MTPIGPKPNPQNQDQDQDQNAVQYLSEIDDESENMDGQDTFQEILPFSTSSSSSTDALLR